MDRFKSRLPSPGLVVALVALVAALAGTAIALPGKNSVDSGDIKKNGVKTADVKNNNLTGKDVKTDTLAGGDIDESTLGTVPAAANAASVDSLKTNGSFERVASSASNNDPLVARASASEVVLFSSGPFTLYGKCFTDADAPETFAEVYIRTSEGGSIFASHEEDEQDGDPGFLEPGTLEINRQIESASDGPNAADFESEPTTFYAASPSGSAVQGEFGVAAKNGTLAGGNGVYGEGDSCLFFGHMIVS